MTQEVAKFDLMLRIPADLYNQMINHLQECYPEEGCGLLAGQGDTAVAFYPIENELHSPTRYQMAPAAQIEAMLDLEEKGWELLALFHSHPHSAAYPSPTDVKEAAYPDTYCLIVSQQVSPPHAALFQIKNNEIFTMTLLIV